MAQDARHGEAAQCFVIPISCSSQSKCCHRSAVVTARRGTVLPVSLSLQIYTRCYCVMD